MAIKRHDRLDPRGQAFAGDWGGYAPPAGLTVLRERTRLDQAINGYRRIEREVDEALGRQNRIDLPERRLMRGIRAGHRKGQRGRAH